MPARSMRYMKFLFVLAQQRAAAISQIQIYLFVINTRELIWLRSHTTKSLKALQTH